MRLVAPIVLLVLAAPAGGADAPPPPPPDVGAKPSGGGPGADAWKAVAPTVAPEAEDEAEGATTTVIGLQPRALIGGFLYEGAFRRVTSVYCDPRTGEIYVADGGNDIIGIFDERGMPLFAFSDTEHLTQPTRVRVDRTGRIYVSDTDYGRLKVFNYRGEFLTYIDVAALAKRPVVIGAFAFDELDNLYVGDSSRGEILVLNHRWEIKERFGSGGTGPGEFTSISSIFVGPERIYVSDHVGLGLQVFSRHGRYQFGFGAHDIGKRNVSLPSGIAADEKGRILLVDTLRHEIKYFEADGALIDIFGGAGEQPGEVKYPVDVGIGRGGVVCVAEKGNHRVQLLEPVMGRPDVVLDAAARGGLSR